jgi:hypothetical protein
MLAKLQNRLMEKQNQPPPKSSMGSPPTQPMPSWWPAIPAVVSAWRKRFRIVTDSTRVL